MPSIDALLHEVNERTIAQKIKVPHDKCRMGYQPSAPTVADFDAFKELVTDYYNRHHTQCVSHGGSLSRGDAWARGRGLLERAYRRRGGDINSAYNDAHEGTSDGLRGILDLLADGLKAEAVENYMRDAFDRNVAPNSYEEKVELIRQFIARCGQDLSREIETDRPERYANDFEDLIRAYVAALERTSSAFRRL